MFVSKRTEKQKLKSWKQIPIGGSIEEAASSLKFETGTWRTLKPVIDEKKCINCLQCVHFCPDNCIELKNGKRGKVNGFYCKGCGICTEVCPVKCISMVKN